MPTKRRYKRNLAGAVPEPMIRTLEGGLVFEVVGKAMIDLRCLTSLFPAPLALCIATVLARRFAHCRPSTIKNYCYCARKLAAYGQRNDDHRSALARGSSATQIGSAKTWHDLLHAYAAELRCSGISEAHLGTCIKQTNTIANYLVEAGLAPLVSLPVQPAGWRQRSQHKPGVLERIGGLEGLDKVMENIRSLLGERQLALDSDELKSLTLIGQRLATGVEQSEDAVVGAISQGTQELLSGIRQVAEQRLNHIMTRKREAERLVAQYGNPRATQLYDEWLNIKGIGGNTSIERHKILEELFPSGKLDEANANWLVLIKERFGGIAPPPTRRGIPKRYEKCFLPSVGGLVGADDITSISVPGLAACCILYMVDSLSNVSTALELSEQCIQPTDDPRVQRVQSIKPRAGYEAIITDFQVNDSSVLISVPQAIHFIKEQTAIVRARLGLSDEYLFVCAKRSNDGTIAPYVLNSGALRNWLNLMMGGKRNEKPLVTPSSIRVSGLMYRTLENGGDVLMTRLHAQHAPGTGDSEQYARSYPVKLVYMSKVRHFTNYLQNKIVFTHLELKNAFGLTQTAAIKMLEKAERTGYGFDCKSPFSNYQQAPEGSTRCGDVGERCLSCQGGVFYIDFENLVDVLCLRADLLNRREDLEANAAAKWEKEYIPLLAYAEVVIEKAKRSSHAAIFRKAQLHVDELARKNLLPKFIL